MKNKKGQAAVEFLTTYGWALMAILILLGALAYFDLFDRDRYVGEGCDTGAQLQCLESTMSEDGVLRLNVRNNYALNVTVENIHIRIDNEEYTDNPNVVIERGESGIVEYDHGGTMPALDLSSGRRANIDLILEFGRETSTNRYNVTGSTVVQIE